MTALKEKARIFWMVKGYLPAAKIIEDSYDGYLSRLWGNEEAYLRVEEFEDAWNKYKNILED